MALLAPCGAARGLPAGRWPGRWRCAPRLLRVPITVLVLVAMTLGSVGGVRATAHAHPQLAAHHHAVGAAGQAGTAGSHGHVHVEPGPQAPRRLSSIGDHHRIGRRQLGDRLSRASAALLVLLQVARPRAAVPVAACDGRPAAPAFRALLCVYRI